MEVEGKDRKGDSFGQKYPRLKKIVEVSKTLPDRFNPVWHLFWLMNAHVRHKAMINMELALSMSYVVDGFSKNDKKLFTIENEGETITPQQSFVNFFNLKDLSGVSVPKFVCGFVDLFSRHGDEGMEELRKAKEVDVEMIDRFGERFVVLINPTEEIGKNIHRTLRVRLSIFLVGFFQKIRRLIRVLLSGTGSID